MAASVAQHSFKSKCTSVSRSRRYLPGILSEISQRELREKIMERRDLCRRMVNTGVLAIAGGFILLGVQTLNPGPASSASHDSEVHLRLVDRLDRPEDGYCLDIPGPPSNVFIQLPLFAHNCSPSLKIDTAVEFTSEGFIKFPRVDRCVTVAGVKSALPGSSIMLSECNPTNLLIDISPRQRFTHRDDGSLALSGTKLCLTVGPRSAETLFPVHRWRPLFVDDCAAAKPARSRWEFVVPNS